MHLSVAVATYNGETYIGDQLESILGQTRAPDELVVCDDASTDSTTKIVSDFAKTAPFPVRTVLNRANSGLYANFEKAISLCEGDIIFLCDQDDVWLPEKLARFESTFISHPEAGAVFSDAFVVDELLNPLGYTLWEKEHFTAWEQQQFRKGRAVSVLLRHNVVQGASLAFRSDLRDAILPIPRTLNNKIWVHDGWIALVIAAVSQLRMIETPLIYYRHHSHNLIAKSEVTSVLPPLTIMQAMQKVVKVLLTGQRPAAPKEFRRDVDALIQQYALVLNHLGQLEGSATSDTACQELENRIRHLEARADLPIHLAHRIVPIVKEFVAGRYHRWSDGLRSAGRDLLQE